MTTRRVLLVGHCGPDAHMLLQVIGRALPDVPIERINDGKTLAEATSEDLLVINRALDGPFDASDGIELIRAVMQDESPPVAMLVSNFEEAQAAAEAAGAHPGFGKRDAYDPQTTTRLQAAAGL